MTVPEQPPPLNFLFDGPDDARLTVVLAHGASAPVDTPFLTDFARGLAADVKADHHVHVSTSVTGSKPLLLSRLGSLYSR